MANVIKIDRRNENERIEHLDNGLCRLIIQRGQHYHDRDAGEFIDTPTDLLADDRSAGFTHVHKGRSWKRLARGGTHRVGFGIGQDVTYVPVGAADVAPEIAGNTALYRNLWPSTDVELQVFPEGCKETLTLQDASAPLTFAWNVQTRGCVFDGGEFIEDLTGKVLGQLGSVHAIDAAGATVPVDVAYGEALSLTVQPGEATVWPVTIDPTTTIQPDAAAGVDTFNKLSSPTANAGTATNLETTGTQGYVFVKFDVSAIPASAVIMSAMLGLHCFSAYSYSTSGCIAPVTQPWDELQLTWNNRLTGTPWGTAGGDVDAANQVAFASTPTNGAPVWHDWDIAPIVRRWVSGGQANYGVRLRCDSGYIYQYYSSDNATNRPRLVVTWTVLPAPSTPIGTSVAPGAVLDEVTPRLSWANSPAVTQTKYQVQVVDLADNIKRDSGEVTSANLYDDVTSAAGLQYGVAYKWRVQIYDGSMWSGYSPWQYFVCRPAAPVGLTATGDEATARVDLAWTASGAEGLAGYRVYRRNQGETTWTHLTSAIANSHVDRAPECGQTHEYAVTVMTANGTESDKSAVASAAVAFDGVWIDDSLVTIDQVPAMTHPRIGSTRPTIDGGVEAQDWGWGKRSLAVRLVFDSQSELNALRALLGAGTHYYRDDMGNALAGRITADTIEQPASQQLYRKRGSLPIVLQEV